jgi:predicted small secreted protein
MNSSKFFRVAAALICLFAVASCANTIRGVGKDTANAAHATEDAGNSVKHAVQ